MKQQYKSLVEEEGRFTKIKSEIRELGVIKMMNKNKRFGFIKRIGKPDTFFPYSQLETHIGHYNKRNQVESYYKEGTVVTFFVGEHSRNKKVSALSICELDYYLELDKNLPESFEVLLKNELVELKKPSIKNVYEEMRSFLLFNSPEGIMKDGMKKARWVSLLSVYKQSEEYQGLNVLTFNSRWEEEAGLLDIDSFLFYIRQLDWVNGIKNNGPKSIEIARKLYQYFVNNGLSLREYIKVDSKRFDFLLSMVELEKDFGEFKEVASFVENQSVTPVIFNNKLGLVDNETYRIILEPTYGIKGPEHNSKRSFQKTPVSSNGMWGLWDFETNKLAAECKWNSCEYDLYTDSYLIVVRNPNEDKSKFGKLDGQGVEMIPPIYDNVYYSEVLKSYIVHKDGYMGLIDIGGVVRIRIEDGISKIENFNGDVKVHKGGLVGVYTKDGVLEVPCKYEAVTHGGNFIAVCLSGKWGVIHKETKKLIIPIEHAYNSFYFLQDYIGLKVEDLWSVLDAEGKTVAPPKFTSFSNYKSEFYIRDLWSDRTMATKLENGAFIYDPQMKQKGIIDLEKRIIKYENGVEQQV
ncbi:hypothetical protein bcgnr5378_05250 [Bacillus cereus]|uniref:Cold-shock domain-containing protein n=1 Tax=Bacillus cereus TaxID=1396 RepID=A0A164LDF8_BACCE|nr:WG repeat-containing protein [Bacillus cereus]KZD55694.1 hypothetical protein B4088_5439 [Bacillus cereus]